MFSTWKYDPETAEVQNLRQAFDPVTARSSQHQACNRCHGKKLKCSGEKDGCQRCITNQLTCEYTRSSSRGSRRGKKTRRRSAESGIQDDSPPSSQGTISRTRSWQSQNLSPGLGVSPKQREAQLPVTSSPPPTFASTTYEEPQRMLDHIDSLLMPSDAFDLACLSDSEGGEKMSVETPTTNVASGYGPPVAKESLSPTLTETAFHPGSHLHHHQQPSHEQPPPTSGYHDPWSTPYSTQSRNPAISTAVTSHPNTVITEQGYAVDQQGHSCCHDFHQQQQQDPSQAGVFQNLQFWSGTDGGV